MNKKPETKTKAEEDAKKDMKTAAEMPKAEDAAIKDMTDAAKPADTPAMQGD